MFTMQNNDFFSEKESHVATDMTSKSWKKLTDENTIVFQSTTHIRSDQTKTNMHRNSSDIKVASFVLGCIAGILLFVHLLLKRFARRFYFYETRHQRENI